MESRTLDNLVLENEDLILEGDTTINGDVEIKNGDLIVSGDLTIDGKLNIENGSIIVSGILKVIRNNISITGGNISCGSLDCYDINITDGDIWVNGILNAGDIYSDCNIQVRADATVGDITGLNYFINGNNYSCNIKTAQDIYIGGDNDSWALTAREILVCGDCSTDNHLITAHRFVCPGELSCGGLFIE